MHHILEGNEEKEVGDVCSDKRSQTDTSDDGRVRWDYVHETRYGCRRGTQRGGQRGFRGRSRICQRTQRPRTAGGHPVGVGVRGARGGELLGISMRSKGRGVYTGRRTSERGPVPVDRGA